MFEVRAEVRRIERQVVREVVTDVGVMHPGLIQKTPAGKLRRAYTLALLEFRGFDAACARQR